MMIAGSLRNSALGGLAMMSIALAACSGGPLLRSADPPPAAPAEVAPHNRALPPRGSPLAVGDRVPEFTLLDQHGREVSTGELLMGQGTVAVFIPGVDAPGARPVFEWALRHQAFLGQQGLEVLLISPQSPPLNARAAEEWGLRLGILSDPASWIARGFGIVAEGRRHPSTAHLFLIGQDGRFHFAGATLPPPSDLVVAARTRPGKGRDPFFSF